MDSERRAREWQLDGPRRGRARLVGVAFAVAPLAFVVSVHKHLFTAVAKRCLLSRVTNGGPEPTAHVIASGAGRPE